MGHKSIQRQLALVSYGSKFLAKKLELGEWCRHPIFPDDFPLWLDTLARAGATRLSLHPAESLDGNRYMVVVHFPECYQAWVASNAGRMQGSLEVPETNWKELATAIAADLEIAVPAGDAPLCVHTQLGEEWAKMPLFRGPSLSHQILATLYREQAKFENDTHPKNESSYYQHLDAVGAAAVDHWGERLASWIGEVHLRCANDVGGTAQEMQPLRRLQEPPPALQPESKSEATIPFAKVQPPAKGKWTDRIALGVAIAALSLLILACANIIARFPWLAVLVGLPWVLYMRRMK